MKRRRKREKETKKNGEDAIFDCSGCGREGKNLAVNEKG